MEKFRQEAHDDSCRDPQGRWETVDLTFIKDREEESSLHVENPANMWQKGLWSDETNI